MKNTTSNFPQVSRSDHLIRSPSLISGATGNSTPMAAVITPSPNSRGSLSNEKVDSSQKTDDAEIPFAEGDGTWRKHGKLFRSNIVLADEETGGNMFALSDSCAIERYYRVADRVLEQFLSSNIAERNELIGCYIVGNRLFKFLSVVLPTHRQYFSTDPRLEKLRNCSESQLMELLEYMEELELMIDEIEYNRYILKDLRPSEAKDSIWEGDTTTHEVPQEEWVADGNFTQGLRGTRRMDNRVNNDDVRAATQQDMSAHFKKESPSEKEQQQHRQWNRAHRLDQRNGTNKKIVGGNMIPSPQPIEALNQTKKNSAPNSFDSLNQHEILKKRVAAVVTGSSSAENPTNTRRPVQPTFSGTRLAKSGSAPSANPENICFDSFPHMGFAGFQDFSQNDFEDRGLFQHTLFPPRRAEVWKNSSEQNVMQPSLESLEDSEMSWDADFSQFNVFSSEKTEGEDFPGFRTTSNIDLMLQDQDPPCTRGGNQLDRPKPLPKIKEPPVPYPRSVWGHAQVHAARLSSSFEGHKLNENEHDMGVRSAFSDCSSDVFYSLEDPRPKPEPVKTRIEERLERASRDVTSSDKQVSFAISQYENSSMLESNSHRKLLNQFRGCVRFLLD